MTLNNSTSSSLQFFRTILGIWFVVVFVVVGLLTCVAMLWPIDRHRRHVVHVNARLIFRLGGAPIRLVGFERFPTHPCIIIANHQSYLDGPLLRGLIPSTFNFVIKNGMRDAPLAGFLLRRIGSEFVDRTDSHRGGVDAKRFFKKANQSPRWVIFPEGTFDDRVGVLPFLPGAFGAARHAQLPIVTLGIQGTRAMLCSDQWRLLPQPITVRLLSVYPPPQDREQMRALAIQTREEIATAIGEPLIEPLTPRARPLHSNP